MKPSFERVHWLIDSAFSDGDGSLKAFKHGGGTADGYLSDEFLYGVMDATSSSPLYWPLQEFIYADGELEHPILWAAQQVRETMPEFSGSARPLLFTGEAVFPYFDDLYVDSGLQLDTLSHISNSHYWTTNEFDHDGVHGDFVFRHLLEEARNRGDLETIYK